jgi:hypothetical protein
MNPWKSIVLQMTLKKTKKWRLKAPKIWKLDFFAHFVVKNVPPTPDPIAPGGKYGVYGSKETGIPKGGIIDDFLF